MKKIFITRNGVLAPQKEGKWAYFSNSGVFRREASFDEVDYLVNQGILIPAEVSDFEYKIEELPIWKLLWSVTDHDDSQMIESLSSNGGAYGHRSTRTYYGAVINGEFTVRVATKKWSTSDFFQDDDGRYCSQGNCIDYYLVNAENIPIRVIEDVYYDEGESVFQRTSILEQFSQEITLDQALIDSETNISSPYTWDGRLEYESEVTTKILKFSDLKSRFLRLRELGVTRYPARYQERRRRTHSSGRR